MYASLTCIQLAFTRIFDIWRPGQVAETCSGVTPDRIRRPVVMRRTHLFHEVNEEPHPDSTIVYTVPAAGLAVVTNIVATNPSSTTAGVTVSLGGTPLISGVGIAPSSVLTLDVRQVLNAGEPITVRGAGAIAHIHISGAEMT